MYRSFSLMVGMALVAAHAATASAAEVSFSPRLSAGLSYYQLDLDGAIVVGDDSVDDIEFSDLLYFVGGGLTLTYRRYFVDVYGQYSFAGEDELDLDIVAGGAAIDDLAQDFEFDRIETALTLGYRVTDQFATFVGFRYADVTFDGSGSIGAIASDFSTDFNQKGPFVGASYVVPKTVLDGTVVVNGAVAYLFGDLDNTFESNVLANDLNVDVNGRAIGVNVGASWVKPLTEDVNLSIGTDLSRYDFDDDDGQSDFDELIARLRTELRFSF
ncbi:MAG: hypothetical protein AAFO01_13510 [Pseudomonadota bacterium]